MKVDVSGSKLSYQDSGKGLPVIFIHAFPLNRRMWDEQVAAFERRCRVIAIDLRGFGDSEPIEGIYTVDQMASDVKGVMSALDIESAVLVGLSMGGYASFAFYRLYRDAVLGLVLSNTRATADSPEAREKRLNSAKRAESEGTTASVSEMVSLLIGGKTAASREDIVRRVRGLAESTPAATIAAAQRGMASRPDSTPILESIDVPVLVVGGTDDAIVGRAEVESMQQRIPGSTIRIIEDAGHLSNLERPAEFNRVLSDFLTSRMGL